MYIFLSAVRLEEEEEYENYLMITPECFDKLLVRVKDVITKYIANMRDASTPKLKLAANIFHVHLFVVLFCLFFLLMRRFKILTGCFSSNLFDELEHVLIFKNWKNVSNFPVYIIKFI